MDGKTRQLEKAQNAIEDGRGDEALAIAKGLLRKNSHDAAAQFLAGRVYCMAEKATLALPYLRRAAAALPEDASIKLTLAKALSQLGLLSEAIEIARTAELLYGEPHHATIEGQMLLGDLFSRERKFTEAHACFVKARDLLAAGATTPSECSNVPQLLAATYNDAANALLELGRIDEAISEYRRAIEISPKYDAAWTNLAAALHATGQYEESAEAARHAVKLSPGFPSAWMTLGNALNELGRWKEARQAYDGVLAIDPLSREARYNRSFTGLALGDWSAWDDYRLRHVIEPTVKVASGLPRWNGETLTGKTILVRREQGIGTQIMFSGYLPGLSNGAEKVIVECDKRLRRLLARSLECITFAPTSEIFEATRQQGPVDWKIPTPDVEIAIGDLPSALRNVRQNNDWQRNVEPPSLVPDLDLIDKWRGRLARLGTTPRIGISWRGGGTTHARQKRSTRLEHWLPVFAAKAEFVTLQYGDVHDELTEFEKQAGMRLHRWDDFDPTNDLDDLAALLSQLDLVISVDNSTAHLAGAVFAPVWVLLPQAADWRWFAEGEKSPWYPSATLISPQSRGDVWEHTFSDVANRVQRFVHSFHLKTAQAG